MLEENMMRSKGQLFSQLCDKFFMYITQTWMKETRASTNMKIVTRKNSTSKMKRTYNKN